MLHIHIYIFTCLLVYSTQFIASEHRFIFYVKLFRILSTLNEVILPMKHQNSYPYDIRHYHHIELHTKVVYCGTQPCCMAKRIPVLNCTSHMSPLSPTECSSGCV